VAPPPRPRRYKAQQVTGEPPRVLGCLLGTHTARTVDIANSFEIKYDGFVNGVPQLDHAFLTQKQEQCACVTLPRARVTAACAARTNLDARKPSSRAFFWWHSSVCRCYARAQTRRCSPSSTSLDGTPRARSCRRQTWSCSARCASPAAAGPLARCGACSLTRGLPVRAQMTAITESPVFVLFNPAVRSAVSKDLPITLYESGAFCGSLLVCVPTAGKLMRSPA
jgi:hypothetical protein